MEFVEGSTLLSGDIGAGKTSILLGIEFALFGLQPGQRGSSLLRNGADSGKVVIEFEADRKEVIIERTLKRGKSISQDSCVVTIDGERKEISVMELKSLILDILNYPKEFSKKQNLLYKFTVYTPQEEMKQIILQDSETRINTLRHIFGIDKYKKIFDNTSILTTKLREERKVMQGVGLNITEEKSDLMKKENDLEEKHYNLASVEKELFLKTEERKKAEEEKEEVYKKIEEKVKVQQEIEKIKIMISNKEEIFSNNVLVVEQLENQFRKLEDLRFDESEITKFEERLVSKKKEKDEDNENLISVSLRINSLNEKNKENEEVKMRVAHLETCPTCMQNVDPIYKENIFSKINSEIEIYSKKIEVLNQERKILFEKLEMVNPEIQEIENKIRELNLIKIKIENIEEKRKQVESINNSNNILKEEIEKLNNEILVFSNLFNELKNFEEVFEEKQGKFDLALKEERYAEIKVAELRREIQVFSIQIGELRERIKKSEEIIKKVNYLIEIENWLSSDFSKLISLIEKNIMIKLKSEFSKIFSEWFSMLVSDSFNVYVTDDFTPMIEQQDYELDYSYLSGGERTAIALAYRLALNQLINSVLSNIKTKDIVILDEPTDGFSDAQLDKMRDVLEQLNIGQLIIVSHEQKIEGFVENVIRLKKENGVSCVDE
jgi:exonuclease SbcC